MQKAFSLVELSIVLVILGLLTGGILAGQSLIRAAELRSIVSEYQRYTTAMQSFRDKYMAIPGDMPNATRFWGDDAAVCADAAIPNGTPGTCNGNGDGDIWWGTTEMHRFWQHLALAGLIEGTYTGIAGPGGVAHTTIGVNGPRAKMSNTGWGMASYVSVGEVYQFDGIYKNTLHFGRETSNNLPSSPALRPEEAWNVDTKIDDGKPAYGIVKTRYWDNGCSAADDGSNSSSDFAASYRLTDRSLQCNLFFIER